MTISFNTISPSDRASSLNIEIEGRKKSYASYYIPPTVGLLGQYIVGKAPTDYLPVKVINAEKVGELAGFGSHSHRMAKAIEKENPGVFQQGGGVYWFPIADAGSAAAATQTITATGTCTKAGTLYFSVGGDLVTVAIANTDANTAVATKIDAAVTALRDIAVSSGVATNVVTLTAKTLGTCGNELRLVQSPAGDIQSDKAPEGITIALGAEYFTSGSGDPAINDAFFNASSEDILGDRWYTIFVQPYQDTTNIATFNNAMEARFEPTSHKLCGGVTGYVNKTYTQALALSATVNSEFIGLVWDNRCLAPSFELAADLVGRIANEQNLAPSRPYKNTEIGLAFLDTDNLGYSYLDALFRAGMSYCKVLDNGQPIWGDIALSYRSTTLGAATEEWFDYVSLSLRQAKAYSIDQVFNSSPYDRAVVVDNSSVTTKDFAVRPKDIVADITKIINDLWIPEAWSKNAAEIIASLAAEINTGNESRIDATLTDDEARALRIIAIKYGFLY